MAIKKKIVFKLEQDEDGYPPVGYEGIWAEEIEDKVYRIDGIPFFTYEATDSDTISAKLVDGELHFDGVISKSQNSLLRVVYFDGSDPFAIRAQIKAIGCDTEWDKDHCLISVSVPDSLKYKSLIAYLDAESKAGSLDFEEAIIRS